MLRSISITSLVLLFACDSDKGVTAFNAKPEASITSHSDGDSVQEGYLIAFRGSASDPNHSYEELTATWYVGSEVLCEATVPESDGTVQCDGILLPTDTEVTLEVKDDGNATGNASVSLTVEPTGAPESIIIAPETSGIYYSDQLITFAGILSDAEDNAETLTGYWESNLGGTLSDIEVTPNTDGEIEGFGYLTEGEHAIQLHVEDSTGKTGSSSVIIDVGPPNSAPLCEIIDPVTGSAGPEGEVVTFMATASDVDVPSDWLSINWSSDKDGELGSSTPNSSGEVSFPYEGLSVNTHVISMVVTDELGETCTADVIYTVGTPPSLTVISPIQNEVYAEGNPITFEATASDSEDQPTAIAMSWDIDGTVISTIGPDSTGTARFDDSSLASGGHTLTVTATDTDGLYAVDVISFSINGVPSAPTVSITPVPTYTNSTLTANASDSIDPEGAAVNYGFEWLQNGQATTYNTATVPDSATTKNETWTVRVTPNDGISDGPFTETSVVILNTAPTITNVGISPSSPSNTDTLTCNYTITDPDESPSTTVMWTNNTTGATLGNSDSLVLTTATASVSDSITCSVTTTDSDGANDSGSASTVIINRLPVVNSVIISPSSASNVDTLTCSVDATDADGDSLTTSYAWTNITTGAALGATDTLVLESSIATPTDEIQCAVSIDDGNTGTDSGSDSIIINNTTPTVSNVSISPSTALTDSVLSCSGTATDADEDALTISYEWRNGSNILGNSDTLSLNNTLASPSDSITCIITASDPHGASASDSDSVVVDNIDPTVDSVSISPSTAVHGDTLTCLASASDADGGSPTLSYVWTINGSTESTTDTLVLSNAIDGDAVVCSVTATDADGGTDTGSDSLTVDNTAPATDTVSLSPVSVTSQTPTVTCTATGSDVDNDPLTYVYEWLIDTQVQSETSNMLNGPFAVDSVLACTVTTNDGKADGNTLSATTTVENTDPTIDSVSITPDSGITTTTSLSCLGNASDVDGGSPAISYEWTVSGNVVGSAMQLNLTPSMVSPSDTVTCTATATDSNGGTASDSTGVTVENTVPVFTADASITPSTGVLTGTLLNCTAVATDIDDGSATLSYVWLNGTNVIGSGQTTTVSASNSDVGDSLTCEVTATDSDGGTTVSTAAVSVENTAPSLSSAAIAPNTGVTTSTVLSCSGQSTDNDGEAVTTTYAWTNQTQATSLGNSATLVLTPSTVAPADVVLCTVTATDPHGDSDSVDVSVDVENTIPTIQSIGISPDSGVTTTSTVSCQVSASDVDGGTPVISYEWTVSGNVVGSAMQLDLTPSMVSPSDTVTCTATATDSSGGTASDSTGVTVENTDPVFTADASITPDTGVITGTVLNCAAVATDIDDGSATLNYVWLNGTNVIGSGQTTTVSASNSDVGDSITCEVTATDNDGGTTLSTAAVSVENTAPSLSSAAIAPNSGVTTSTVLSCSGQSTDNDGEAVTTTYTWTNQTQATSLGNSATLVLTPSTVAPADVVLCTVTVTDPHGDSDSVDVSVDVENTDPIIQNIGISPDSGVATNTSLLCQVSASDVDGGTPAITYEWTVSGNVVGSAMQLDLTPSMVSPSDTVTCTATATDSSDGTASNSAAVTVENTDPVFTADASITPNTGVITDTDLSCSAIANDIDDGTVTLSYVWLNGTNVIGSGQTTTVSASNSDVGDSLTCEVTATDSDGGTTVSTATVNVENTAPNITNSAITPNSGITTSSTLMCSSQSTDNDGEAITTSYAWTNQTQATSLGNGATLVLTPSTVAPEDVILCTITATDPHGDSDSVDASVDVENTDPVVSTVTLTPNSGVKNGDGLTCSATSSDADGSAVTMSYSWTINGIASGSGASITLDTATDGDVVECTATAVDANGGIDQGTANLIVENTAPVITGVALTPSNPTSQTSALTCTVSATDADGDSIALTYEWQIDGQVQSETSNMLSGSFVVGNLIACRVIPTDGKDTGAPVGDSVTVENTPPNVTSLTLGPTAVYTNDTLTATATLDDVDGQTVRANYAWHVIDFATGSDTLVQNGLDNTLSGVTHFDRDDEVYVVVTPNDGIDNGFAETSASMTIRNTAPSAPVVSLSPNPATEGQDDLVCVVNVSSSDDDGDAVLYTYEWRNPSGSVVQTTADSPVLSNTFAASGTSEGDWTCDVTADDGTDIGGSDSATVTVDRACPAGGDGLAVDCPSMDCAKIMADGYSTGDGNYWIDPDGSGAFEVYCDMTTRGGGWTLIESYDFAYRSDYSMQPFSVDFPRNASAPNWDDYRLASSEMSPLLSMSSEVHARCHRDYLQSQEDNMFADIALVTNTLSGSIDSDGSNPYNVEGYIRGYDIQSEDLWFYGEYGGYHQHVDGLRLPNAASSEDNFGWADSGGTNTNHLCHSSSGEIVWMVRRDMSVSNGNGVAASWDNCSQSLTTSDARYTLYGQSGEGAGAAVASGDFNGDGIGDLVLSANNGGTGRVYIVLGYSISTNTDLSSSDHIIEAENGGDWVGQALAAGDIDGDGLDDIIIGAPKNTIGGNDAGKVYIILGSSLGGSQTFNVSQADYSYVGTQNQGIGIGIAAGDFDNDGLSDVLVGQQNSDGGAYIITGASLGSPFSNAPVSNATHRFVTDQVGNGMGYTLANAGDVDGDGLDDILLGASFHTTNTQTLAGRFSGRTYLVYGASLGSGGDFNVSNADAIFNGESSQDRSAYKVSGAGDIDGDGLDDILIGAWWNDDGGNNAGKVYAVYASTILLTQSQSHNLANADIRLIGENPEDQTSFLASAGDLDGDGLGDIIVGSSDVDDNGSRSGKTYLILSESVNQGGSFDLSQSDFSIIGDHANDHLGGTIAAVQDIDLDGVDEIIIGSPGNDDNGTSSGKMSIFSACESLP